MLRLFSLLAMISLLLVSCGGVSLPDQDSAATASTTRIPALQLFQTSTPSPIGTWEMVIEGLIYDQSTGQPIAGATIRYIVIHSYYLEIQEGRVKETTSNKEGRFSLPMIVHDTDNIHLRVEADTFISYEEKLDLFGDRGFSIGLTPSELATGSAP